jgi:hypothetical protein
MSAKGRPLDDLSQGFAADAVDRCADELAEWLAIPPDRRKLLRRLIARAVRQALEPEALQLEVDVFDPGAPGLLYE